jgi:hypothetical protein
MNIDQVYDNILQQRIKHAKVLNESGNVVFYITKRPRMEITPEQVVEEIKAFVSRNPGRYHFLLKQYPQAKVETKYNQVDCMGAVNVEILSDNRESTQFQGAPALSEKQIREQIYKEIQETERLRQIEAEREEYKTKTAELETWAGKLAYVGEIIFARLSGNLPMSAPATGVVLQGVPEDLTEDEIKRANACLHSLVSIMDIQTLESFTAALVKNPSLINFLKTQL